MSHRLACLTLCLTLLPAVTRAEGLTITPPQVKLEGNFAQAQLLARDGASPADLTWKGEWQSADPAFVTVTATGRLQAMQNGKTTVRFTHGGQEVSVPVEVSGICETPVIGFHEHVQPILSKAGCNMGACHAAQYGQGGLKLSVFGFDPKEDHAGIVRDRQQRRLNFLDPERSLFLMKPTLEVPHGGSRRLVKDSPDYQILKAWIGAGAPGPQAEPPQVTRLIITPAEREAVVGESQQLQVVAEYKGGRLRDVTAWAKFDSMDDGVVNVTETGVATTCGQGQAPVMVRFEGQAGIAMFIVPYGGSVPLAGWEQRNFIDELAAKKFRQLGIEPSGLCDDATFLRRAFLDVTGSLPTPEETRSFLESTDPGKRDQLVDRLLGLTGQPDLDIYNDRYAAWWTLKWSDLLRNSSGALGDQGMWAMHNWLKESFRTNRPFDEMVAELVTAKGSIYKTGPANYFRINGNSSDLAESTAQLFLGVRLGCAKCHHHPFEKYSEADYYGFAAFFSRVSTKNSEEFGLFGRETVVLVRSTGEVRHPRTGKNLPPTPLEGEAVDHPLDRRIALASWLTGKDNRYFAESVVNRYLAYLLGQGLVEPVDDLRATNPPSNPALMTALADEFIRSDFNLKQVLRLILTSRLYQLSSQPTESNRNAERYYAWYQVKRLPAEALLDAVDQATGVQTKHTNLPLGTRAIELPDAEYPNYFLTTFAKPRRASVCECERSPDESLAQALHTLNGDILAGKISHRQGRIARLLAAKLEPQAIISDIYLATLCRLPSAEELQLWQEFLRTDAPAQEVYEDLLWTLMNSKQFLFVR